jgi:DNA-binding transcriptional regulator YiaG
MPRRPIPHTPDPISPEQCRAARAWLGWSQGELSQRSQVGTSAIKDFEGGNRRTRATVWALLKRVFEDEGVEFPPNAIRVEPDPNVATMPRLRE